MFKKLFSVAAILVLGLSLKAQMYSTLAGKVTFFSKTPLEDINGTNEKVLAVLTSKGEIAVSMTNTEFVFPNKLMQEHFNEKYMESDKHPKSTFRGKINESIDLSKDGEYKVTVSGKLEIHGVEKERTISGVIIVKDGKYELRSTFMVKNADHKIEIPTVVNTKIAEEIEVKVDLILTPKVKN